MLRINLFSVSAIIFSFLLLYLFFSTLFPTQTVTEYGILPLIIGLLFILPIHKALHCIPVWMLGKKAYLSFQKKHSTLSGMIHCYIPSPLSRNVSIITLLFPVIIITLLCAIGAYLSPEHMHYFVIISSINMGISVYDFVYVSHLFRAPRNSFIEDFPEGFHILVNRTNVIFTEGERESV